MAACTIIESACQIDWGATGSMLSALAAILGIPYIGWQVRMSRKASQEQAVAAKLDAKSRLLDLSNPINNIIFRNPELYEFSYPGKKENTPPENSVEWKRLMIICEMQANYIEFAIHALDALDKNEKESWKNFISDTMNRPIFREFWKSRYKWYDPKLQTYVSA